MNQIYRNISTLVSENFRTPLQTFHGTSLPDWVTGVTVEIRLN